MIGMAAKEWNDLPTDHRNNLVPRVSLSPSPRSWGRGERDPGNEVDHRNCSSLKIFETKFFTDLDKTDHKCI